MKYDLRVDFPLDVTFKVDEAMAAIVGRPTDYSGSAGDTRDLGWEFDSQVEASGVAKRLSDAFVFATIVVKPRPDGEDEDYYIIGWTGQTIFVNRPTAGMIHPLDVVEASGKTCRWGGMCDTMYVVAEHCLRVMELVPPPLRLQALLHDAPEAYLNDVPRPVKHSRGLEGYREMEHKFAVAIGERFGVDLVNLDPLVKEADERLLRTEERDLMPNSPGLDYENGINIPGGLLPERITPLEWRVARARFARALAQLTGELIEVVSGGVPGGGVIG
jgi:uncharacterized protein